MRAAFVACLTGLITLASGAGTSRAAEPWIGRWAADPGACANATAAGAQLIATESALRWSAEACRIGKIYKIGQAVHIQAHCWSDKGLRNLPVMLSPRGDRLNVSWDKAPVREMHRCR